MMIHSIFIESPHILEVSLALQHIEIFIFRLIQLHKSIMRNYFSSGTAFPSYNPNN